jgi:chromosome partitioning protein
MSKCMTIANQKGGVGKTTTAINVGVYLALEGKRTLLIDADPQGNATSGVGLDKNNVNSDSIYEVLIEGRLITKTIKPTAFENLLVLPSSKKLAGAEIELVNVNRRESIMKNAIDECKNQFEYVLIDCPPSLGILTLNALCAADSVIVPLQCEYYALEGISALLETVDRVRSSINPALYIEGILLTMFDSRTNLSDQVASDVRRHFRDQVFDTIIPRNVRLSEAPSHGLPVVLYDSMCKGAFAYRALAQEIASRET